MRISKLFAQCKKLLAPLLEKRWGISKRCAKKGNFSENRVPFFSRQISQVTDSLELSLAF
eukprot:6133648-Pleurochrysis_carterae.AAC.1